MTVRAKLAVTTLIVALAGTANGPAASQGLEDTYQASMSSIYGLYRDMDGGLWCGGACMPGQRCCMINILPAE